MSGVASGDYLAIQFEDNPQHAVGGGVRGAHIQRQLLARAIRPPPALCALAQGFSSSYQGVRLLLPCSNFAALFSLDTCPTS